APKRVPYEPSTAADLGLAAVSVAEMRKCESHSPIAAARDAASCMLPSASSQDGIDSSTVPLQLSSMLLLGISVARGPMFALLSSQSPCIGLVPSLSASAFSAPPQRLGMVLPQTVPLVQPPHSRMLPQPSEMVPQAPSDTHVAGIHIVGPQWLAPAP